jgi:hypothetical protein
MSKHRVEFDYKVGDRVIISDIEMKGRIDALQSNVNGKQYRVVYWNSGSRNSVLMYAWEIKRADSQ